MRPEYLADIFATLNWLGIEWHEGPKTLAEVQAFSQRERITRYNKLIDKLIATGRVYACTCTRSEILARTGATEYDGHCRSRGHALIKTPVLRFVSGDKLSDGDFIIRRRDLLPAYHIASLADDLDFGVNLIIRGEDLLTSTAAQRELAEALGQEGQGFLAAEIWHHALITDPNGNKFSKSVLTSAGPIRRDAADSDAVQRSARQILEAMSRFRKLNR